MEESKQLMLPTEGESKIDLFRKKEIRKVMHEGEWWFSLTDVIVALVDTEYPKQYIQDMRKRDPGLDSNWEEIILPLEIIAADGKKRKASTVNIEGIFRLIQSIPSPKVEPFKKWLAKVGFERLQEIQNPDLALKRAVTLYRAKGYDDGWIEARIKNKASRELLTAEWKKGGVERYIPILTDAIYVETFGIKTAVHKEIKGLKGQSLRDNMTPIELTLTTLGEQVTTEIIQNTKPNSFAKHKLAAEKGGSIAGNTRRQIEDTTGKSVISPKNYLTEKQRKNNKSSSEFTDAIHDLLGNNS